MTVQFEQWLVKVDATGRAPIYLIAYFDGHRLRFSVKEKCTVKQWDAEKQQFRRSFPGYQEANETLQAEANRVHATYRRLRADHGSVTPDQLRAALAALTTPAAPPVSTSPDLVKLFDAYRVVLKARGFSYHTLKSYGTVLNRLRDFSDLGGGLTLADYTSGTHDEFLGYLRDVVGLAQNTIASIVKSLKPFLSWARDDAGHSINIDPRRLSVDWEDKDKAWLTAAELVQLERAMLPESLTRVRDAFLFCCWTGLRYSDLAALHEGNLTTWNGATVLRLTQTKTRTSVAIYLTPPALALLAKYDGARSRLLPVTSNTVMNRYLKRIARLAGISSLVETVDVVAGRVLKRSVEKWSLVTMHTARHTFAVQSLMRGMSIAVLQKVMGHSRIQSTMIYAKVVEDFQHEEMRRVWEGLAAPGNTGETGGVICEVVPAA